MMKFVQTKPASDTGTEWAAVGQIVTVNAARQPSGDLIVQLTMCNEQDVDVTDPKLAKAILKELGIQEPSAKG